MDVGQAMVVDGLFFLMICGFAASVLLWASSVYGDKSFEAYRYIYMTDYTSSSLAVLSQLDYEYVVGQPPVKVKASWLDELGMFMTGEFDNKSVRYDALQGRWESLCDQAPAPLLLTVFTEYENAVVGSRAAPLYFACGKGDKNLLNILKGEDNTVNPYKYSYYSSPKESKSCSTLRCEMDIKIYY